MDGRLALADARGSWSVSKAESAKAEGGLRRKRRNASKRVSPLGVEITAVAHAGDYTYAGSVGWGDLGIGGMRRHMGRRRKWPGTAPVAGFSLTPEAPPGALAVIAGRVRM